MRSSSAAFAVVAAFAALLPAPPAAAQQPAQGFAVDRLDGSPPGAGWFVMDALEVEGGLGGSASLVVNYAGRPLRIDRPGAAPLAVISGEATATFAFAITCDRWRLSLDMTAPLALDGESGTIQGRAFSAPSVDLSSRPDTVADVGIAADGRLWGEASGPVRLGASVKLFVPSGERADYVTDGSYRAMGKLLLAGDVGHFTYAGMVGVHVRPLDDAPTPESPRGSELLVGAAAGGRLLLTTKTALVIGPEIFGETAFAALLGRRATGLEALLTGRLEHAFAGGLELRGRLGAGGGLIREFGAPEWRAVAGIELGGHAE